MEQNYKMDHFNPNKNYINNMNDRNSNQKIFLTFD